MQGHIINHLVPIDCSDLVESIQGGRPSRFIMPKVPKYAPDSSLLQLVVMLDLSLTVEDFAGVPSVCQLLISHRAEGATDIIQYGSKADLTAFCVGVNTID